tara:strand:- start:35 stop:553 length:519 start_codon:yes stop_codon:yes gene_type:complete
MALVLNGSNDTITGLQINSANIVDGSITTADCATGTLKILQKVHQQSTTSQTTSGSTKLDVLTLSITPASSSNQILLLAQLSAYMIPTSNATSGVYIYRGGSAGSGTNVSHSIFWDNDSNGTYANHGLAIIDTPNTTSATTYHLTLARQSGNTNTVSTDGYHYSLIALEVAA